MVKFNFDLEIDPEVFVEDLKGKEKRDLLNILMDDYMESKAWKDAKNEFEFSRKRNVVNWMQGMFLQCGFPVDNLEKHWNGLLDGKDWDEFFWYLESIRERYSKTFIEMKDHDDQTIFYCPLCGKPWLVNSRSEFPAHWTMSCGDHVGNLEADDGSYTFTVSVIKKEKKDEVTLSASDNP